MSTSQSASSDTPTRARHPAVRQAVQLAADLREPSHVGRAEKVCSGVPYSLMEPRLLQMLSRRHTLPNAGREGVPERSGQCPCEGGEDVRRSCPAWTIPRNYVGVMTIPCLTLRSVAAALAALCIPAVVATAPAMAATAAPGDAVVYDALGDSYGSGFGVPPYSATCGRSSAAYAVQIDGQMRIELDDFAACAGATTGSLLATQLDALDEDTDLVTLSVGGNDIGWGSVVGACVVGGDTQCETALSSVRNVIETVLPGLLDATYTQIVAAAPDAHVVVTGYPRLFSPEYGAYYNASPAEQQEMNDGADVLNAVIAEVAGDYGFQFVDVTDRFVDHGVNAPEPWVLGLTDPGRFHPNLAGYRAYAAAVTSSVNPRDLR